MNDADFKKLVMAAGVRETAVIDARLRYSELGDDGVGVTDFIEGVKARGDKTHWWPNTFEKDSIDPKLVEAACGAKPTLDARAALLKAAGPDLCAEFLSDWGVSDKLLARDGNLAPGKNPNASGDSGEKKKAPRDHSNNPFSRQAWSITAQGDLVKRLGLAKANAIAKSVGSHVGATRPNADY